jgi:hypothetical protein
MRHSDIQAVQDILHCAAGNGRHAICSRLENTRTITLELPACVWLWVLSILVDQLADEYDDKSSALRREHPMSTGGRRHKPAGRPDGGDVDKSYTAGTRPDFDRWGDPAKYDG